LDILANRAQECSLQEDDPPPLFPSVDFLSPALVVGLLSFFDESASLESVECLEAKADQPVSKDIASRILCLPIYDQLARSDQSRIIKIIVAELKA
jgi:hypothetical protein